MGRVLHGLAFLQLYCLFTDQLLPKPQVPNQAHFLQDVVTETPSRRSYQKYHCLFVSSISH